MFISLIDSVILYSHYGFKKMLAIFTYTSVVSQCSLFAFVQVSTFYALESRASNSEAVFTDVCSNFLRMSVPLESVIYISMTSRNYIHSSMDS